ncbi:MAG: N-acetyltransferase family protein [Alphaproteobacteria bacterium]
MRWGTKHLPYLKLEATERWLERSVDAFGLVAELEGQVVANANWSRRGGRTAHMAELGMMVHDEDTGRGMGRALLDALVEAAFETPPPSASTGAPAPCARASCAATSYAAAATRRCW